MTFHIVERELDAGGAAVRQTVLPTRYDTEDRATAAIKMKIALADHAGRDAEGRVWWAQNEGGPKLSYQAVDRAKAVA